LVLEITAWLSTTKQERIDNGTEDIKCIRHSEEQRKESKVVSWKTTTDGWIQSQNSEDVGDKVDLKR